MMMLQKALPILLIAVAPVVAQPPQAVAFRPATDPVFQVDYPAPTADKPQSKLWFMDGSWWALLPRASGPSLWQRTDSGWAEHAEVARALGGSPGRADVWLEDAGVTAAAVADATKTNRAITVFRLVRERAGSGIRWDARILAELSPPSPEDAIETVTLARDTSGAWWAAAVAGTQVCVWTAAADAALWSAPVVLARGLDPDDICVVSPLSENEIAVIWSDQVRAGFLMRAHVDGEPASAWRDEEVIQMSPDAADDHLNTARSPDGTLWLASKNEIDKAGRPQFTLHMRNRHGAWSNWPYGIRTETTRPSRPIVVASADGSAVLTGYGDNDRAVDFPHDAKVMFSRVNPAHPEMVEAPRAVIAPDRAHQSFIQNVTGPRAPFPADAPWIVLASDQEGRVYEADLREAFPEALPGGAP